MGFKKSWSVEQLYSSIRAIAFEASNPRNDGWTSLGCKRDLYQLKCFLDDIYQDLPHFSDEKIWEQER